MSSGKQANSQQNIKYTGIQVQTSALGVCIPLAYGTNMGAPNLIWYNNFQATPDGKGGGGKGGGKSNNYTYTAAVILAICEGTIDGVSYVVSNGSSTTLGALGLYLATGTSTQEPQDYVTDNYPNQALAYRDTAYLFAENLNLGSSASIPSLSFVVTAKFYQWANEWADANPADVIQDIITSQQYGLGETAADYLDTGSWANYKTYCTAQKLLISPYMSTQEQMTSIFQRWAQLSNSWIFWTGTCFKAVPLASQSITANGVTFTANNTPIIDIGPNDYLFDVGSNEDPVAVDIKDPVTGYNTVELDYRQRDADYNTNSVYFRDQNSININGNLASQVISANEVCDDGIAAVMVTLIGQRTVNINNNYEFKLDTGFVWLEPGDIITITEPNIGLNKFPIMISEVSEDASFVLTVKGEEYPAGIGIPAELQVEPNGNTGGTGIYDSPGSVNDPPLIFEPAPIEAGGGSQIWIGASGPLTTWGGCHVWASVDDVNYAVIGTITNTTVQGTLTTSISESASVTFALDTGETPVAPSMYATGQSEAANQTIIRVDEEIISYGAITLDSGTTYTISSTTRAVYDSTLGTHAVGADAYFLVPASVVQLNLQAQYIGNDVYFKFTSFNLFGNEEELLSDVVAYTYVPQGKYLQIAPPTSVSATASYSGSIYQGVEVTWDASVGPNLGGYNFALSTTNTLVGPEVGSCSGGLTATLLTPYQVPESAVGTDSIQMQAFNNGNSVQSTWTTFSEGVITA
jgi:hypothetical protein